MRFVFLLIFSLLSFLASAQNLSETQAQDYARRFFVQSGQPVTRSSDLTLVWDGEETATRGGESPAFYVFNRGENQGFVIISASQSTMPVLGYSFEGGFSPNDMPKNLQTWMKGLRQTVKSIEHQGVIPSQKVVDAWSHIQAKGEEKDLQTPDWDQGEPYNLKCPAAYGKNCYTGCAITAMAIVMGYHQWPDVGMGTLPAYTTTSYRTRIEPVALGEKYLWNKMPYINGNSLDDSDQAQRDAISTLMFHVGVMGRADFTLYATAASLAVLSDGMPSYMKYNARIRYQHRKSYMDELWIKMLREEIDAKRPVVYEGFDDTNVGHAFVLDGYKDGGYFKVNWGWSGLNNGFYLLSDMAPGSQGAGGSASGTFNLKQGAVMGIEPREESSVGQDHLEFISSTAFSNGITTDGMHLPVKQGDGFFVDAGLVRNVGTAVFNGYFSLVMTDHNGKVIETFSKERVEDLMPAHNALGTSTISVITIHEEVKAAYRIRLLYKSDRSEVWTPVKCDPAVGKWEILLNNDQPAADPLDEVSSISYNPQTRKLLISTQDGVAVKVLEKATNRDCSLALSGSQSTFTLDCSQLEKGKYVIELRRDKQTKTFDISL